MVQLLVCVYHQLQFPSEIVLGNVLFDPSLPLSFFFHAISICIQGIISLTDDIVGATIINLVHLVSSSMEFAIKG